MKKTIVLLAVAAVLFTIAPAAQASIFPAGEYRVLFVTRGSAPDEPGTQPGDTNMAALNAWVNTVAAAGSETAAISTTWSVVGATTLVDALTNTGLGTTGGVPIYLVDGTQNWADSAAFWANANTSNKILDEDGGNTGPQGSSAVLTGLDSGPATAAGFELDAAGRIQHGGYDSGYTPWYGGTTWYTSDINTTGLFVISDVIPEPATMSLLAIGGIALLRRKRR
jgi:hypothetical protein